MKNECIWCNPDNNIDFSMPVDICNHHIIEVTKDRLAFGMMDSVFVLETARRVFHD